MGILRIASTLAAAAVAFSGYAAYRRRHGLATPRRLAHSAEPLQRWEGEGGAVPAVKRPAAARRGDGGSEVTADGSVASATATR